MSSPDIDVTPSFLCSDALLSKGLFLTILDKTTIVLLYLLALLYFSAEPEQFTIDKLCIYYLASSSIRLSAP